MMFKVGDKIRVLVDGADGANVNKGDEFTIKELEPDDCAGYVSTHGHYGWCFSFKNIELVTGNK